MDYIIISIISGLNLVVTVWHSIDMMHKIIKMSLFKLQTASIELLVVTSIKNSFIYSIIFITRVDVGTTESSMADINWIFQLTDRKGFQKQKSQFSKSLLYI